MLRPLRSPLFPYTTLFRSFFPGGVPGNISRPLLGLRREETRYNRYLIADPEKALLDRKSTRLNSSHQIISYAVFCLKKKNRTAPLARTASAPRCRPTPLEP